MKSKNKTDRHAGAAAAAGEISIDPALPVPARLVDYYPDALRVVKRTVQYQSAREWDADLPWRLWHLFASVIAAEKHDGLVPGSVRRPGVGVIAVPEQVGDIRRGRRDSTIATHLVPENDENITDARRTHVKMYDYSERYKAEFEAEIDELVTAATRSPARAWDAYLHVEALDRAAKEYERTATALKQERDRLRVAGCPICHDSDTERIGPVKSRRLLDGADPGYNRSVYVVRSCHLCWEYAHDAYLAQHASTSAGANRAELVVALAQLERN